MSPSPTRLPGRNADDAAGDVCRWHSNADLPVGGSQGAMERTQPGHDIDIDWRNARTRTATGNLTIAQDIQHMNEGRHEHGPRPIRTGGSIVFFGSLPIGNGLPKRPGSFWCRAALGHRALTEWISDGCRPGWINIWPTCGQTC